MNWQTLTLSLQGRLKVKMLFLHHIPRRNYLNFYGERQKLFAGLLKWSLFFQSWSLLVTKSNKDFSYQHWFWGYFRQEFDFFRPKYDTK